MRLLGPRVLFAEYRSSDALKAGVASFRDSLALFVLLSLLIALPLFYVLGGRSVGVLYRAALQRARRDGLTDLDNHRAFQDELSRAVGEATRYGSDVTLALLDIDDFKFENDRHGHQHGDRLLCELAELLRERAPATAPSASAATSSPSCSTTRASATPTCRSSASASRSSAASPA